MILLGISTAVTQKLLEHSSPDLTNKDKLLRREQVYRYNQIPAVLLSPKDITSYHPPMVAYTLRFLTGSDVSEFSTRTLRYFTMGLTSKVFRTVLLGVQVRTTC